MNAAESAVKNDWMEGMLGEFLDESGQLLERLNENLLRLDALVRSETSAGHPPCDEALLNEMFRSAHSLKGLSGMLGLTDINSLTHRLENVFDAARKEGLHVTRDVVDLMFRAVDHLDKMVATLKNPSAEPIECGTVIEGIHRLLESHGVERKQSSQADAEKAIAELANHHGVAPLATEAETLPLTPLQNDGETSPTLDPKPEHDPFAGIEDDVSVADKYIPIFIDDAGLSLDRLAETLLAIDGRGGRESLKTLLHVAHQVKGSAATVGLNRPAKLAHLMEDLLQNLVDSGGVLSPEATEAMLKCTDKLRQYLDNLKEGRSGPDGFGEVASELLAAQAAGMVVNQVIAGHVEPAEVDASAVRLELTITPDSLMRQAAGITGHLRRCVEATAPVGAPCLIGQVRFQPRLPMAGLKGQLVYNKLANLGEVCYFDPPQQQLDELDVLECVSFGLVSDKPVDVVREHLKIAGVDELTVETLFGDKPGTQDARAAADPAGPGGAAATALAAEPIATALSTSVAKQAEPGDAGGAAARGRNVPTEGAAHSNRDPAGRYRAT